MKKTVSVLLFVAALVAGSIAAAGCRKQQEVKKVKIAYLNSNANDMWLTYLQKAFEDYFSDKPEFELSFLDGQEDVLRQQDQVNSAIVNGANVLVVIPIDTNSVSQITRAAADAGIPLVYLNRNPYGDNVFPPNVYAVGSEDRIAGEIQAEEMGRLLNGKGNVCIITGDMSHEGAVNRTAGNEEILKSGFPGIIVLAKEPGRWFREQGYTVAQNLLMAYSDLQGILCNNDEMALGVVKAAAEANRKLFIIGVDATSDGVAAVADGSMAATVFQDAVGQGKGAAEVAVKLAQGEKVNTTTWVPFRLVTKANVTEFLN
jgi:inositol transport system substrate-binding protein